ncbi:2-oxo-4-hydroxy-4-carboxy-5-ureidoimidazoline decarboxylase [Cephus cinctus]|uniref:2-oxo-4-hydroxy-4-carboxy-5-ureidoimidazoline decarboxylase n=1 Tax=Cephus cinctus TaxID=211228 RepID=A0AAJ7FSI1_CEPCN|nr:2-oxo-4-hydroxy-4-carboxy-5-ureidoimidazoline decarboxylase [Cephus cinctus]
MSAGGILSIAEVNALPLEQFDWLFGNVVEHCPEAARAVVSKRPFVNKEALKKSFDDYLENLDDTGKESVLLKHPDLAGKLAEVGKLTQESSNEQKSAGLDALTKEEKQTLNNYNYLYKEKFQFPFVICARRNKVATIFEGIENRLKNSRTEELNTGINEVKKICRIRIDDLVWSNA